MIVVAGEALVDLIVAVDGSVSAELGGGPFNVARTIGRLGRDVSLLASMSVDRFGDMLVERAVADGVNPSMIVRADLPTTLAVAELDESGAASYRFYIDSTSAPALHSVQPTALPPEAVHVGTLGLVLEPLATSVEWYLSTLGDDTLVMLDPNCRSRVIHDRDAYLARIARVLAVSHVVKISTDDAAYLAPEISAIELARLMVERGVRAVLVTAGGDETTVVTSRGTASVAIPATTVVDTIGAGDSFCGGFLAAWLGAGRVLADLSDVALVAATVAAANEVAAATCSRVGADPPWLDQLRPGWGAA